MHEKYDVAVIGAGVIGSAIARELSKYQLRIAVLEKNLDVCNETSGRNSAVVHGGFAYDVGSLKSRFCVAGNRMMDRLSEELDFPFKRCGKVLVGNTEEDMRQLERVMEQGRQNGVEGLTLIDGEKLHELVPAVVGEFAMWSPASGIMDPFLFTVALAENAHDNGVEYHFDSEVLSAVREEEGYRLVTSSGEYSARWVVNAAGLGCKKISDMFGITGYHVIGSKGNYIILDKRTGALLPMPVYPVPSNTYMGIHVTPTVDGNVIVGPDAENVTDFTYYGVEQRNMDYLAEDAARLWPHIHKQDQIRNYSGILPKWVDEHGVIQDFKIEIRDDIAPNLVNLVGIESPGLTAAVPIAQYVTELMSERETFRKDPDFCPRRKGIVRFSEAAPEEQQRLIEENPDYGEMICRCEKVTKAELLEAVHNPLGVTTMTGIKYRTRAMMGRCQGGFCQTKLEKILEQETGKTEEEIRYSRQGSWVLAGKLR
ncbi:NAD(P)/FAD-dependent oxidoreductase [Lachnospiraceae bacterium LCP19S3_B12]